MMEYDTIQNPKANIMLLCFVFLAGYWAPFDWGSIVGFGLNLIFIIVLYVVGTIVATNLFPDEDVGNRVDNDDKPKKKGIYKSEITINPHPHGIQITREKYKDLLWFNGELYMISDDFVKEYGSSGKWIAYARTTTEEKLLELESRMDELKVLQQNSIQFIQAAKELENK